MNDMSRTRIGGNNPPETLAQEFAIEFADDLREVDGLVTAAATVPVPQDSVSPTPRSWTRICTASSTGGVTISRLTPDGKNPVSHCGAVATGRSASASPVSPGTTQARCGLPMSTPVPVYRTPPSSAADSPRTTGRPMSTLTSASEPVTTKRSSGRALTMAMAAAMKRERGQRRLMVEAPGWKATIVASCQPRSASA